MAIKEAFMEKIGLAGTSVEVEAKTGESLLIKDISIETVGDPDYVLLKIEKTSVGYFRTGNTDFNQLPLHRYGVYNKTLINYLRGLGVNMDIPVAEGQKFTVTADETFVVLKIVYEVHDAGDMTKVMPNGSEADEYVFVNYGTNSAVIDSAGFHTLDKSINPVDFPDFPFGKDVPADTEIDLLGIMFSEYEVNTYPASADKYFRTERLRFIQGRKTLFDDDKLGFYVLGDGAAAGSVNEDYAGGVSQLPFHNESLYGKVFMLPEPKIFTAGVELNVQVKVGGDATAEIPAEKIVCGLILRVRKLA